MEYKHPTIYYLKKMLHKPIGSH